MAGISFESFLKKSTEILASKQGDVLSLGVDKSGMLGTFKVTSNPLSPQDKQLLDTAKTDLTNSLTQMFGVDSMDRLPLTVRTILTDINRAERMSAEDIQRLGATVKDEFETRETVRTELSAQTAAAGEKISGLLKALLGEDITLPARCPLAKLLQDTFDSFMKCHASKPSKTLFDNRAALGRELSSLLMGVVDGVFGSTGKDGELAQRLAKAAADAKDMEPEARKHLFEQVLAEFVPQDGKPIEPPPESLGKAELEGTEERYTADEPLFEGALGQPKPVAELSSTKKCDLEAEANSGAKWFLAQLRELTGDPEIKLKLPRLSSPAEHIRSFLKAAKTVGDLRASIKDLFTAFFTGTTKEQPVPLMETIPEACRGMSTGAKRLIIHDLLAREGVQKDSKQELAALGSTIMLAIEDFPMRMKMNEPYANDPEFEIDIDDWPEPFAACNDMLEQIVFLANEAEKKGEGMNEKEALAAKCKAMRTLVNALKKDDANTILSDESLKNFTPRDTIQAMCSSMNGYTDANILAALECAHSPLLHDGNFRLYLNQCLGIAPREVKNGELITRMAGWESRQDYLEAIYQAIQDGNIHSTGISYSPVEYTDPKLYVCRTENPTVKSV